MTGPVAVSPVPLENRPQAIVHPATEAERLGHDTFLDRARISFALGALR